MKRAGWIYWVKLGISSLLLFFLYEKIALHESIIAAFRDTRWLNVAFCIMLLIPNIYLAYLKWRYLLKKHFETMADRAIFGSLLFGYTLGVLTPGSLGELGRGLFFQNKNRLTITGLSILDKMANQLIFFTCGCLSLLNLIAIQNIVSGEKLKFLLYGGGTIGGIAWAVFLDPGGIKRIFKNLKLPLKNNSRWYPLFSVYKNFKLKDRLIIMGISLIWLLVIVAQYHLLVSAFTSVSFWESLQAVTATLFVKALLPISLGDLGIREGVAVFFYAVFQVSAAAVFNSALLIFVINSLLPALAGIYYLFQIKSRRKAENASIKYSCYER